MAVSGDGLSLLFKISAQNLASAEIKKLRTEISGLAGSSGVGGLATSLGFTSQGIANFAKSTVAATTAIVGLVAGAYTLARASADFGDSIFKAEQKTRFTAEALSIAKLAAQETNTSFDQLVRGMARFEVNVSKGVINPSSAAAKALKELGIQAEFAAAHPQAAFLEVTKRLEALSDVTQRDRLALALFGRDFQSLIPVLEQLGSGFDETKKRAQDLGLVMSEDAVRDAHNFAVEARDLDAVIAGLSRNIGTALVPSLRELMEAFESTGKEGQESFSIIDATLGNIIRGLADVIEDVKEWKRIMSGEEGDNIRALFGKNYADVAPNAIPQIKTPSLIVPLQTPKAPSADEKEAARDAEREQRKAEAEAKRAQAEREKRIKDASDARIEIIQIEREASERIYQQIVDNENSTVDQRLAAEERYLKTLQDLNLRERDEIQYQEDNAQKRVARETKLDEQLNQMLVDSEKRRRELRKTATEDQKKALDELIQARTNFYRRDDELWEIRDERDRRRVEERERTGFIRESEAQEQLAVIEQAAIVRREDAVIEEFKILLATQEGYGEKAKDLSLKELTQLEAKTEREKDLQHQLIVAEMQRADAVEAATQRILDARIREVEQPRPSGGFPEETEEQKRGNLILDRDNPPPPGLIKHIDALKTLKATAKDAFASVANGLGQLINNYVLFGTVGPNAIRKVLAATLAAVAQEAAVKAIFALAEGFIHLFTNPAQSAADFTAAALYGAVAGVALITGRAVAGNAFQQQGAGGSSTATNSPTGTAQTTPPPVVRTEDRQPQHLIVEVRSKDSHILNVFEKDVQNNGRTRGLIIKTAGAT